MTVKPHWRMRCFQRAGYPPVYCMELTYPGLRFTGHWQKSTMWTQSTGEAIRKAGEL